MENLNENIKVFFLDLDGTLLDDTKDGKHWISDANVKAIKKVQKQGKHVIISTGRYGLGVQQYMKRAGVKYAVTGNGSRVVDNKGHIYKDDKLTLKQSLLIFNFVKENKLSIKLDGAAESFGAITWLQQKMSKKFGFFPNPNYNMPMKKRYSKIVIWGKTKGRIHRLGEQLQELVPGISVVSSAMGWTLEVTNYKSTKGAGNLFVARELLGIKEASALVHVGDTLNDSTAAPHMRLIAMKNGTKSLKALASHIGPDYKNGGVAKILNGEYKKIEK